MLLHNEKVGYTPEHQDRFINQRSINIIHINRIRNNLVISSDVDKAFDKIAFISHLALKDRIYLKNMDSFSSYCGLL